MIKLVTDGDFINLVYVDTVTVDNVQQQINKNDDAFEFAALPNGNIYLKFGDMTFQDKDPTDFEIDGLQVTDSDDFRTKFNALFNIGGGGEQILLKSDTIILSDSQIKALPTTPVEVISAPGLNKFISLVQGIAILDNMAGGYSNIAGGTITVMFFTVGAQVASNLYVESDMGDLEFPGSSPFPLIFSPSASIGTGLFAAAGPTDANSVNNQSLYITAANGGSNFTGGNAANTLKVIVYYTVIDL